ncbi:MAG: Lon protease family protein [Candidatus Brocadiia bacterium]
MGAEKLLDQKRVPLEKLRRSVDPDFFSFDTTAEVEPLEGTIGQQRALEAVETGLQIQGHGFNIYASGQVGTGRNSTVHALIKDKSEDMPVPDDWVYLYNFDEKDEPLAVNLPPGKGRELRDDMEDLIQQCKDEIPKAFEGEDYEKKRRQVVEELNEKRSEMIDELREEAKEYDHAIQVSPAGIAAAPIVDDEVISQDEFDELPEEKKEELRSKNEKVQELIRETIARAREIEKEIKQRTGELDENVGLFAVGHLVDELKEKYSEFDRVCDYLDNVKDDIIENIDLFRTADQAAQDPMGMQEAMRKQAYNRYRANVVVDNARTEGAPVVDERNPTYYNLFGQIEYKSQFGGMTTDFTMIRAGSFIQASGGFIVLQVKDVLRNPFSWEALKRAIRAREVKIENMYEQYRPIPAATLEPEAIPVSVTVVLVGSPLLYHLLYTLDEDFRRLFKIKAAFDVEMDMTDEHLERYAAFVSDHCEDGDLPPFDRKAVAKISEYGARLAGHQERLSTQFLKIADLIEEAGHQVKLNGADCVSAEHVREAILTRHRRSRMAQDKIQRMIEEGTLLIDTEDSVSGQINGLAVLELGEYRFGKPSRITCVSSVGQKGVINIERESDMSGNIHNKGVMIMSGFLAKRFGQEKPLSLSASLCFEQSYSEIEGDSASCAELYALLSDLADVPLRQDIAVTGSVNQKGQVQPIGGVNEKIEGFFEVCQKKGLTGEQGVLIPARNIQDLMVNDEVFEAVEEGDFSIYAIDTVEEGVEILTGMPAGEKDGEEQYPADTLFGRVDSRLCEIADVLQEYGPAREGSENNSE